MSKLIEITGSDLKRIREEKGLTAKELAERVGVSTNDVFVWESGRKNMTLKKIDRICNALKVKARLYFRQ